MLESLALEAFWCPAWLPATGADGHSFPVVLDQICRFCADVLCTPRHPKWHQKPMFRQGQCWLRVHKFFSRKYLDTSSRAPLLLQNKFTLLEGEKKKQKKQQPLNQTKRVLNKEIKQHDRTAVMAFRCMFCIRFPGSWFS